MQTCKAQRHSTSDLPFTWLWGNNSWIEEHTGFISPWISRIYFSKRSTCLERQSWLLLLLWLDSLGFLFTLEPQWLECTSGQPCSGRSSSKYWWRSEARSRFSDENKQFFFRSSFGIEDIILLDCIQFRERLEKQSSELGSFFSWISFRFRKLCHRSQARSLWRVSQFPWKVWRVCHYLWLWSKWSRSDRQSILSRHEDGNFTDSLRQGYEEEVEAGFLVLLWADRNDYLEGLWSGRWQTLSGNRKCSNRSTGRGSTCRICQRRHGWTKGWRRSQWRRR